MTDLDLTPIDLRLAWASGHAERVRELSADWASSAIRETPTYDPERGVQILRAEVSADPPPAVALALGDLLHHARATLDNLVGVLRGGATSRSAFPIDRDPRRHERHPLPGGSLHGVPPWALAVVREFQPFDENPWRHVGNALADLHELAIIDRHRALLLAGVGAIDINQVWASTNHPEQTDFWIREGGRTLEVEYPADAQTSVHLGASILVTEDRLRWTGEAARYPFFPTATDVATNALWAVQQVVDEMRREASRS